MVIDGRGVRVCESSHAHRIEDTGESDLSDNLNERDCLVDKLLADPSVIGSPVIIETAEMTRADVLEHIWHFLIATNGGEK